MTQHALDEMKVVNAATELAKKIGFEAVTLTKTATELSIQPQSMYRYVKNTDDLKSKVLAKNLELLVNQLYEQLIGLTGEQALA
ncbi:TetR/AcrR family transcriptional regulator [Companilactobacillus sp. FL22-1]|uniref:TetR/AcrR family transcriptional regulator n=1 Tax=Companilactobacillus sp. FL22-1 TaxID=3373892 RepID=UPI003754452A